jgi:predicted trehalose synthase
LLQLFLTERLVLETRFELLHRPDWLSIPLAALEGRLGGATAPAVPI